MKLRNRLLQIRLQRGYKFQGEFADFLGFNRQHYNKWETNREQPGIENAWKIKKKLGISLDDLFEE